MNHDERLTAGGGAETYGLHLPVTWSPVQVSGFTIGSSSGIYEYVSEGS